MIGRGVRIGGVVHCRRIPLAGPDVTLFVCPSTRVRSTLRWREMDSNFRFRSRGATIFVPLARKFRYRLIIQPGTAYRDVRTAGEPRSGRRPLEALIANGYGQFDELI